jgi:ribosomal protein S18 acetylase RimI-like enzyme
LLFKTTILTFGEDGFFMIKFERAITDDSLWQILDLQKRNLRKNLSEEEIKSQGFLTAEHSFEALKQINDTEPAIVATHHGKVIAYAIAMKKEAAVGMTVFDDLFKTVESLSFKGNPMSSFKYIFVGQLCVDKGFRGQNLVERLYAFYKEQLKHKYDFAITDISENNPRSIKAHQKSGFEIINTFFDNFTGSNWCIVVMDFGK